VGFDEYSDFIAEAAWLSRRFGDRRLSFRTSSQTTLAAAARAGYDIALLPLRKREIAAGERLRPRCHASMPRNSAAS
jgi:DNA-binding transcriptional LysR family regulator